MGSESLRMKLGLFFLLHKSPQSELITRPELLKLIKETLQDSDNYFLSRTLLQKIIQKVTSRNLSQQKKQQGRETKNGRKSLPAVRLTDEKYPKLRTQN